MNRYTDPDDDACLGYEDMDRGLTSRSFQPTMTPAPSTLERVDELRAAWYSASESADAAWTAWADARAAERQAWKAYQNELHLAMEKETRIA